MGYEMKGFSGFKSPAKQTQGISGDQALIASQKELAKQEHSYKAPGWTRMATSILPGHDPSGGAVEQKGKKSKTAKGPGGAREGMEEVRGLMSEIKNIKDFKWKGSGNY
jgi:hypothetical protein